MRIEALPIELSIVVAAMPASVHPCDIPGVIIPAIVIEMVPMRSGHIFVDAMTGVPLVSQAMSREEMAIQWLIDHLIAARDLPIEWHEGVPGAQMGCLGPAAITTHEEMIRGAVN
jgi:hypothetical protein